MTARGRKRFGCAHEKDREDSALLCTDCTDLERSALEVCVEFYRSFPLGKKRFPSLEEQIYAIGKRAVEEKVVE